LRNSLSGDSEGGADLLEGVARLAGILDRLPKLGFRRIDCGSRLSSCSLDPLAGLNDVR